MIFNNYSSTNLHEYRGCLLVKNSFINISEVNRQYLHSLGTRSEDDFEKVSSTTGNSSLAFAIYRIAVDNFPTCCDVTLVLRDIAFVPNLRRSIGQIVKQPLCNPALTASHIRVSPAHQGFAWKNLQNMVLVF